MSAENREMKSAPLPPAEAAMKTLASLADPTVNKTGEELDRLQDAIDSDTNAATSYDDLIVTIRKWTSPDGWTMIRNDRLHPSGTMYRADLLIAGIEKMRDTKGRTSLLAQLPPGTLSRKLAKLHRFSRMT